MQFENNKIIYKDDEERCLFLDLKEYLVKSYKGKRNLKRLCQNITWFMNEGRGDFFAGFVFDVQGTLSCWGIYTGGKDEVKDAAYKKFMQENCDSLLKEKKPGENFVSYAIISAYNVITNEMEKLGLIVESK